jgi:hypothetical protein
MLALGSIAPWLSNMAMHGSAACRCYAGLPAHSSSPGRRRPSGLSDICSPRCSSMRRGSPGKASPSAALR